MKIYLKDNENIYDNNNVGKNKNNKTNIKYIN